MLNTVVSHGLAKCADRFARGVVPVEAAYEHGNEERGSAPKDLAGQAGQTRQQGSASIKDRAAIPGR